MGLIRIHVVGPQARLGLAVLLSLLMMARLCERVFERLMRVSHNVARSCLRSGFGGRKLVISPRYDGGDGEPVVLQNPVVVAVLAGGGGDV